MQSEQVVIAVIGRPHGLKGEVRLELRTDEPERRFARGARVGVEQQPGRELTVAATRWVDGRLLVSFAELADRTAVESAKGWVLVTRVAAEERPEDPEEFYDRQLVGLRVLDVAGVEQGRVSAVQHLPHQDLLVVTTGRGEAWVPFVSALVPVVDQQAGWLQLAEVEGLLDPVEG